MLRHGRVGRPAVLSGLGGIKEDEPLLLGTRASRRYINQTNAR